MFETHLNDRSGRVTPQDCWYLALRVAPPGVHVSGGGENQRVFGSHRHVLDVDPGQRRDLLGPVVVPRSAFWQTDQTVCRKEENMHGFSKKKRKKIQTPGRENL